MPGILFLSLLEPVNFGIDTNGSFSWWINTFLNLPSNLVLLVDCGVGYMKNYGVFRFNILFNHLGYFIFDCLVVIGGLNTWYVDQSQIRTIFSIDIHKNCFVANSFASSLRVHDFWDLWRKIFYFDFCFIWVNLSIAFLFSDVFEVESEFNWASCTHLRILRCNVEASDLVENRGFPNRLTSENADSRDLVLELLVVCQCRFSEINDLHEFFVKQCHWLAWFHCFQFFKLKNVKNLIIFIISLTKFEHFTSKFMQILGYNIIVWTHFMESGWLHFSLEVFLNCSF